MLTHKTSREKGKISFTNFFQKFKEGEMAAVVRELSIPLAYPKKIQGRTGKIIAKRGASYELEISDLGKPKRYIIKPIHLKKIEALK